MKRQIFVTLFLLFAGASFGQPVIDHMLIDESKGELHILGTLGTTQGKVTIDSIDLPIINWSDSLVIAIIPFAGRGSAGRVVVSNNGFQSEARNISIWLVEINDIYTYHLSQGQFGHQYFLDLVMRFDIHSLLLKNTLPDQISFNSSNATRYGYSSWIQTNPTYPTMHDSIITRVTIDTKNKWFIPNNFTDENGGSLRIKYDSNFVIQDGQSDYQCPSIITCWAKWRSQGSNFLPPQKSIVLQDKHDFSISAFPNPSSKELHISCSLPESGNARIVLYTMQGNIIRQENNIFNAGEHLLKWDLSLVASGSYVLGLLTEKEKKFHIIQIVH